MNWVSANKESIKLYNKLQQVSLKGLRIPHSGFRIPDWRFQISTFHKPYKNMADSKFTFHRLLPLLLWVKTIATWRTVIESMQSLGMDASAPRRACTQAKDFMSLPFYRLCCFQWYLFYRVYVSTRLMQRIMLIQGKQMLEMRKLHWI